MERKAICEFLVKNEIGEGELMAYADQGDQGCVAIGHNGMKFRFTPDQLDAAIPKMKEPAAARSEAQAPRPKRKASTTKRKTTTRKAVKK